MPKQVSDLRNAILESEKRHTELTRLLLELAQRPMTPEGCTALIGVASIYLTVATGAFNMALSIAQSSSSLPASDCDERSAHSKKEDSERLH